MAEDAISVAAAVLAAEFVRRENLDQTETVRIWRQLRRRMARALAKEADAPDS